MKDILNHIIGKIKTTKRPPIKISKLIEILKTYDQNLYVVVKNPGTNNSTAITIEEIFENDDTPNEYTDLQDFDHIITEDNEIQIISKFLCIGYAY